MNIVVSIVQALTGFMGSSENPQQMSLRFIGVITGIVTQFAPVIALIMSHMMNIPNVSAESIATNLEPWIYIVGNLAAIFLWSVGALRAVYNKLEVPKTVSGFIQK